MLLFCPTFWASLICVGVCVLERWGEKHLIKYKDLPSSRNLRSDSLRVLSVRNNSLPVNFLVSLSSLSWIFFAPSSVSNLVFHAKNDSTVTLVPSNLF